MRQVMRTRCIVSPSKEGIEYRPTLAIECALGTAAIQMPHVASDVIRSWAGSTRVIGICAK